MPRSSIRLERGERLHKARTAANLSQTHVAEQLCCSRQLVGSWEAGGNITADQLGQLCVLYGCTSDSILFGTPQEAIAEDAAARELAKLEPALRTRLWMFYQVFIRRGINPDISRAPSTRLEQ